MKTVFSDKWSVELLYLKIYNEYNFHIRYIDDIQELLDITVTSVVRNVWLKESIFDHHVE